MDAKEENSIDLEALDEMIRQAVNYRPPQEEARTRRKPTVRYGRRARRQNRKSDKKNART